MERQKTDVVLFDVHDHVALITLNRPNKRNAINGEMSAGIERAVDELENRKDLRAAILTGQGSVFCSGADLAAVSGVHGTDRTTNIITKKGGFAGFVRRDRRKPIIAALQGDAIAGGLEIAIACDLIVAADDIRFALPEASRSLVATAGALNRLPRLIGLNRTQQMILTADPISAQTAYDWGLVNFLVSKNEMMDLAMNLAIKIASHAPLAVQSNRSLAAKAFDMELNDHFRASFKESDMVYRSKDTGEGLKAFLEKREPVWRGE